MYRLLTIAGLAAFAIGCAGCGSDYGNSPTTPGGPSTPPAGAIVIEIVGINGARSFSPNPATVPPGQTVVWHNADTSVHHVVLDDRRLDTGNVAPGAFTAPMTLAAPGPYHCSIHPEMVGTATQ